MSSKTPTKRAKRIAKQPTQKRLTVQQRLQIFADATAVALHGANAEELKTISEELVIVGSGITAVLRQLPEHAEPVLMFTSEPECRLVTVIQQYAEHTNVPIEQVIDEMIMRIGPHAETQHRWN